MDAAGKLSAAFTHYRRDEVEAAERLCREILDAEPGHLRALHLLGLVASRRGDFERAAELHRRAAARDPGDPLPRVRLGRALAASGRGAAAEESYREAIAVDPGCVAAHAELGLLRERAGDPAGALSAYGEALRLDAGLPRVRRHFAAALGRLGRLDEALAQAERAANEAPGLPESRLLLAELRLRRGDAEGAIEDCERCLKQEPRNRRALAFQAVALARGGDWAGSRSLLDLDRLVRLRRLPPPDPYRRVEEFNAALLRALPPSVTSPLPAARAAPPDSGGGRPADDAARLPPSAATLPPAGADLAHPAAGVLPPAPGAALATPDAMPSSAGGELLLGARGTLGALAARLAEAVDWYFDRRPRDPQHPFLSWRPRAFHVRGEALRPPAVAEVEPRIRERGWVSGIYCLRPRSGGGALLEAGAPPPCYAGELRFARRRIALSEGDLVLFPSYFFTAPGAAEGSEPPLVIAFDAVPE